MELNVSGIEKEKTMSHQLSSAYRQNHYMGESTTSGGSGDTEILTFIQNNKWDNAGNGTGVPREGVMYYNTADAELKYYNGTSWVVLTTGGSLGLDDVLANGNETDGNPLNVNSGDTLTIEGGATLAIASGGSFTAAVDDCSLSGTPSDGTDAVNKDYVDSVTQGLDWQDSILDENTTAPGSPTSGDRYIVADVGNASITDVDTTADEFTVAEDLSSAIAADDIIRVCGSTGNDRWYTVASVSGTGPTTIETSESITDATVDGTLYYGTTTDTWITDSSGGPGKIAEYNGSSWDYYPSSSDTDAIEAWEGAAAWDEDADCLLAFNGSTWVKFGSTITHSNLSGLTAVANPHEVSLTEAYEQGKTLELANATGDLTVEIEGSADFIIDDGETNTYFKTLIESSKVQLGSTGVAVDIISVSDGSITNKVGATTQGTFDSNGLTLASGTAINEFSIDGTLAGNSDNAVPTEQAVKTYVDGAISTESLQDAYEQGNTITLDNANGDLTFTIDTAATVHNFIVDDGTNNYLATDATNGQLELGSGSVTVGFLGNVDTNIAFDGSARSIINDSADITIQTTTAVSDVILDAYQDVLIQYQSGTVATFDDSGLTLASGTAINEFSTDGTLADGSDNAVPTEQAVKTYVDNQIDNVPYVTKPDAGSGGNPNSETVVGDAGDIYIDTDNDNVVYMNTDGTTTGWVVIG